MLAAAVGVYPLRVLLWARRAGSARARVHVPASFDPAPVLYPALVPVLVALSLVPDLEAVLVPNLVLGLAALPPQLVPGAGVGRGGAASASAAHWLVATLPLAVSQDTAWSNRLAPARPYMLKTPPPPRGLDPDVVASLFALHHALLTPLHYLTMTSLLPAELHLLSIGLINLLLCARAPHAVVLRALFWIGGLGLWVLCGHTLRWGVALARIPRWRFRHAANVVRAQHSFLRALRARPDPAPAESEADDDDGSVAKRPSRRGSSKSRTRANGFADKKRRRPRASYVQSFLSLTPAQAAARKWAYAAHFYAATGLLILGPIRAYIGTHALHGNEPFGWAIGYLLGDVQPVRFWVVSNGLDDWIPLPPLREPDGRAGQGMLGPCTTRLVLVAYSAAVLGAGLAAIHVVGPLARAEVDTRRKVFHAIMVAIVMPTAPADAPLVALALALVLAVFCLLDVARAAQVPPVAGPLARFVQPFADGRDLRGPVVVSPLFLVVGCAVPLWLSVAAAAAAGAQQQHDADSAGAWPGWAAAPARRDVPGLVAGVVCVGLGDAAASLVGRRFGTHKWPWAGGKSVQGSAAFAGAVAGALVGVRGASALLGGVPGAARGAATVVAKAALCGGLASLHEAVLTGSNDNVVVPLVLWLAVRAVGV